MRTLTESEIRKNVADGDRYAAVCGNYHTPDGKRLSVSVVTDSDGWDVVRILMDVDGQTMTGELDRLETLIANGTLRRVA